MAKFLPKVLMNLITNYDKIARVAPNMADTNNHQLNYWAHRETQYTNCVITMTLQFSLMSMQQHVLVIEDDPTIFNLIEFRLERDGYTVTKASDGHAAMAAFNAELVPHLVVMDVMMPFHNGYELLADLRSRERWKHVPVIMLTSLSREEDILKGLEMGATDYMIKPFRPAELSARVKSLLARKS